MTNESRNQEKKQHQFQQQRRAEQTHMQMWLSENNYIFTEKDRDPNPVNFMLVTGQMFLPE